MKPVLFEPVESPYLVSWKSPFHVHEAPTAPPDDAPSKKKLVERLDAAVERIAKAQQKLYADDRFALLLVFQAMDAAGKDGTIRAVMTGINPAGCQVFTFKAPSPEEVDHDFFWRIWRALPERGRIGIFNRSHYEEVLVVRVHPEFLDNQKLPREVERARLWEERYDSIRDMERHLARNGTVILKFWLNVSRKEQKKRFLDRIEERDANWKFSARDVAERSHWDAYMDAYESAIGATSRPWAPWYAIPADDKPFMRTAVAEIVADTLDALPLRWPAVDPAERGKMEVLRKRLEAGDL